MRAAATLGGPTTKTNMRVLIATVTAGGGHLQAAAAIEEAWQELRPEDQVKKVDLLDLVSRLHRKVYTETYVKLVEHAPELWGMVFKKTDNPEWVRRVADFRATFARRTHRKFVQLLREFAPEIVISTHYLPPEVLAGLRQKQDWTPPFTACVVTDYEAHALWLEQSNDVFCVATEDTQASLVARGIPAERVVATGIPIAARFSQKLNRRAIRKQQGLRNDLPVLLVLSGGFGMGPVAEILAGLDGIKTPLQIVVVAGRNEDLRRELAAQDRRHPTRVLGFATNMHELMAAADLILTKPGGLTTSEALASGKPLFILNPIPGQEAANSDFLLERGAAAKVNRLDDLPHRVAQLLGSKKLVEMAKAAKALGRPHAAVNVCRAVMDRADASA
jgi:processive 1,2-diacylglycerol beta-glucosyltransferase